MNPNCNGCKEVPKDSHIICQILKKKISLEFCNNFNQKERKGKAYWKYKKYLEGGNYD